MNKSTPSPTPELGYEQARHELAEVVAKLESGGVPLADAMKLWERGEELAKICQGWLDGARARVAAARDNSETGDDAADLVAQNADLVN